MDTLKQEYKMEGHTDMEVTKSFFDDIGIAVGFVVESIVVNAHILALKSFKYKEHRQILLDRYLFYFIFFNIRNDNGKKTKLFGCKEVNSWSKNKR